MTESKRDYSRESLYKNNPQTKKQLLTLEMDFHR